MRNNKSKNNKEYSSTFWVMLRTGGIGLFCSIIGFIFLFIETIPEKAIIPLMVSAAFIILLPYIALIKGLKSEPYDETVKESRAEATSVASNLFLEILTTSAFIFVIIETFETKVSTGAVLMFAAAVLCFLQCLIFWAVENRKRTEAGSIDGEEEVLDDSSN